MSAPQFAPGPWRAVRITDPETNHPYCTLYQTWVDIQSESGATICGLWANQGARMADANLIAAAPDLYAELEKALKVLSAYAELIGRASPGWEDIHHAMILCGEQTVFDDTLRVISDGKAALAKARGEGGTR